MDFDWEAIAGSKQYRQRVLGRARREEQRIAVANAEEDTDDRIDAAIPAQEQVHPDDIRNYERTRGAFERIAGKLPNA
jgi:hypothetical protein